LSETPATREQLLAIRPVTEKVALPELGEGVFVVVQGYSVDALLTISGLAARRDEESGRVDYDSRTDMVLSVIYALAEPALTLNDREQILSWPTGVANRIISAAKRIGGQTVDAYEEMKDLMRSNPYLRRLYTACAEVFHCLPSDMADKSEAEFNSALAALEVQAEEEAARIKAE